jgi:cytochrome b561
VIATVPIGMIIEGYDPAVVKQVGATLGEGGFNTLYDLHKSIGITVLGLMIVRLVARATYGAPPYAEPLTAAERIGSHIVHGLLYVVLFATPIVGWIGVSLYTAPAPWFWLVDLRLPLEKNREVSEFLLLSVHGPLAMLLVLLVIGHVSAAFKHLLVNRDGVFYRMIR